jgi:hypothetical protein
MISTTQLTCSSVALACMSTIMLGV